MTTARQVSSPFVAVLFSQAYVASAARVALDVAGSTNQSICIGCNTYPQAPDYSDDWLNSEGVAQTLERWEKMKNSSDPEEMQDHFNLLMHQIVQLLQGQGCMDLCAVCAPKPEELESGEPLKLKSMHITRSKNWQDISIWPVTGAIDTSLGALKGALIGLPVALGAFFIGGGVVGTVAGVGVGSATAGAVGGGALGSGAGNLLGALAGITSGLVSGTALAATTELMGVLLGIIKGVGLVGAVQDCKRVGFERNINGKAMDEEPPFASKAFNSNYGLKRLRRWSQMENNSARQQNSTLSEIKPGDEPALGHCERVREHNFDIRHLAECMKHSQLCDGPALLWPATSAQQCKAFSDVTGLQSMAVSLGDDPEEGLFSLWRKLQEKIREETGYDGKRAQCVNELCKFGGFHQASLNFNPDRSTELSEEEKLESSNMLKFLSDCKSEFGLELNSADERANECPAAKSEQAFWPDLVD